MPIDDKVEDLREDDVPFLQVITERRYAYLALIGLIALLVSFLLASVLSHLHDNLKGHVEEPLLSLLRFCAYLADIFGDLMRDIGFAFWIALVLGALVERAARIEQKSIVRSAIKAIRDNVLSAAYGITVPPAIASLALEKIFSAPVVRETYRLTYKLQEYPPLGDGHVLLKIEIDSIFRNVSGRPIEHEVRLHIPLRTDPVLRHHSKLIGGSIGAAPLIQALIDEGDRAAFDSDYEKHYLWRRPIASGDTLHVIFRVQLVKDRNDNEIWTSLFPSGPPEVSVEVQCPGLEWDVHPQFCGTLPTVEEPRDGPRPSGQIVRFEATAPLLPYHGLVLWWRPKPPERKEPLSLQIIESETISNDVVSSEEPGNHSVAGTPQEGH